MGRLLDLMPEEMVDREVARLEYLAARYADLSAALEAAFGTPVEQEQRTGTTGTAGLQGYRILGQELPPPTAVPVLHIMGSSDITTRRE